MLKVYPRVSQLGWADSIDPLDGSEGAGLKVKNRERRVSVARAV